MGFWVRAGGADTYARSAAVTTAASVRPVAVAVETHTMDASCRHAVAGGRDTLAP